LNLSREHGGIEHWEDVVLDEATGIAGTPGLAAEPLL
jgi:hypothetical protein